MSEEKNLPKWIPVVVTAVATLSVPFLYIVEYAYDKAHLQAYGLSNEFFARSLQEYLVLSFFACFNIARSTLELFTNSIGKFASTVLGIALVSGFLAYKYPNTTQLRGESVSIKRSWLVLPVVLACFASIFPILLLSILIIIIFSFPFSAYSQGQSIAEKEIMNAKVCTYSSAPTEGCVSLLENGKPIAAGRLVARSPSHIALFNRGKTSIYPVKDQLVEAIPPSKKPKGNTP